jgi:hypothetical protein
MVASTDGQVGQQAEQGNEHGSEQAAHGGFLSWVYFAARFPFPQPQKARKDSIHIPKA